MNGTMFHIFRNSPLGRENLLQAIDFCRKLGGLHLRLYRPATSQMMIYLENELLSITLDNSYLRYRDTSLENMQTILNGCGVSYEDFQPQEFTASTIPDIRGDFSFMSCPRAISEKTSRLGLGHIGPKVRAIVKAAPFPVFIPAGAYKPWNSVAAFYGGSPVGLLTVQLAITIADAADLPLTLFTQLNGTRFDDCQAQLDQAGLLDRINSEPRFQWTCFRQNSLDENLIAVPFDSLAVVGAAERSILRELVFGSKLELIQSLLPNPLLIVGPRYRGLGPVDESIESSGL